MLNPMPTHVYGQRGSPYENVAGKVVGKGKRCTLEGCKGWRIPVRWPKGKLTWPCSKGMIDGPENNTMQIF
jgi:hypothetical protein